MEFKIIKFVLSVAGGIVVAYLSALLPFEGPQLFDLGCGHPSGFPFSFVGTWKHLPYGMEVPFCALGFDYVAFTLDALIWFSFIFVALSYFGKILKRKISK